MPKSNMEDVMLEKKYEDMIEIIPIETIEDVLENILMNGSKKERKEDKHDNIIISMLVSKVKYIGFPCLF